MIIYDIIWYIYLIHKKNDIIWSIKTDNPVLYFSKKTDIYYMIFKVTLSLLRKE